MTLPVLTAPEKPKWGEPCNGCGYCCAAEVCSIGKEMHGEDVEAPCPSMRFRDGRFRCGIVEDAERLVPESAKAFHLVMGIGFGCDADDFEDSP